MNVLFLLVRPVHCQADGLREYIYKRGTGKKIVCCFYFRIYNIAGGDNRKILSTLIQSLKLIEKRKLTIRTHKQFIISQLAGTILIM